MNKRISKNASIFGLAALTACSSQRPLAVQIATTTIASSVSKSQKPVFLSGKNDDRNSDFIKSVREELKNRVRVVSIFRRKYDSFFSVNYEKFPQSFTLNIKSDNVHVYCNIPENVDLSENIDSFCYEENSHYLISEPHRSFLDLSRVSSLNGKVKIKSRTTVKSHVLKTDLLKTSAAPAKIPAPTQAAWILYQGVSLRNQLLDWGRRAGWKVVWPVELDWIVPITSSFSGEFSGANGVLAQVAKALNKQGRETHLVFYEGNKTAIVTTGSAK